MHYFIALKDAFFHNASGITCTLYKSLVLKDISDAFGILATCIHEAILFLPSTVCRPVANEEGCARSYLRPVL